MLYQLTTPAHRLRIGDADAFFPIRNPHSEIRNDLLVQG